ncbi:type II CAAX endopeptidase family protein [Fructilactobacillus vespulae]|uniref:CPBP family intramembrane glutamic endopeptidase n=1 Tax=Fructilactobacillus vespulae TaxID=1249630 RepID=UPI0039B596D8
MDKSNSFKSIAIVTVAFSIIWTGLSAIFNIFAKAGYNEFFKNTDTIFWHVTAPMGLTFILFFGYLVYKGKVKQVYQRQPEIQSTLLKWVAGLITVAMLLFAIYNFYKNFTDIFNNWNSDSLSRIVMACIATMLVGLTEESVFRGYALSQFRQENSEFKSYLFSVILFGFWHLPNIISGAPVAQAAAQTLSTMLIGSGLYLSVRFCRSVFGGMALHWLWDFALVIAIDRI